MKGKGLGLFNAGSKLAFDEWTGLFTSPDSDKLHAAAGIVNSVAGKTVGSSGGEGNVAKGISVWHFHSSPKKADAFARPDGERFSSEQQWQYLENGEPYFDQAPVAMRARMHSSLQVGGSRLIAAEILDIFHGPTDQHLLYQDRRYLGLSTALHLEQGQRK